MSTDPKNSSLTKDLDWLAFCYINDELEANELVSFEDRLSVDQSAREAVERAVNQQMLIAAGLHAGREHAVAARVESNGAVPTSRRRDVQGQPGRARGLLIPKFVFAAAATLLVALASWMQWGHLIQTQKPAEVADRGDASSDWVESEEWFGNEEYANRLVDALVETTHSDNGLSIDEEITPATLQVDPMQDVFSEIGDEWIEMEDVDDSELDSTDSDWSWG